MDQDASGWKTLLTRANQLVRSATHPAAQLPVEGHLPSFDGATGWLNSPPLTAGDLRGRPFPSGHHMAEEAPDALAAELLAFLA